MTGRGSSVIKYLNRKGRLIINGTIRRKNFMGNGRHGSIERKTKLMEKVTTRYKEERIFNNKFERH